MTNVINENSNRLIIVYRIIIELIEKYCHSQKYAIHKNSIHLN